MSTIPKKEWRRVAQLYRSGLSMSKVAERCGVSPGAVVYVLRKLKVPRRSVAEANSIVFETKPPSFIIQPACTPVQKDLEVAGAMLHWAEGYKTIQASGVDFANSDIEMVFIFMKFLRSRYILNEKRLRPMLYCYANQDPIVLTKFWSSTLNIPAKQFTKPYVRADYRTHSREMRHGLIHIRYNDKKLLRDILGLIESLKVHYASVG